MFNLRRFLDETFRDCVRSQADLTPEQREAIDFMLSKPSSALFLDVGYGKTVISLTVLSRLIWEQGYTGKILIVAPIRVATRVWPREARLWRHLAWMRMTILRIEDDDPRLLVLPRNKRTAQKELLRRELLNSGDQIHIVNQEAVQWLVDRWNEKGGWPYRVVVFDESSRLRDHNSVVFRALHSVRGRIKRFHELTATPASQTYMHLFSQIWLLDQGERFGNGVTAFRERYFTHNFYARTWTIREGAAEEIERLIADICLVMRRKRDFWVSIRPVQLSREKRDQYEEFEEESVLELSEDLTIDGVNAAVLSSKLLQFASGFVYDKQGHAHDIHGEKIEELNSLITETLDQPVLVGYWFQQSLVRLKRAFPHAAVMDKTGRVEEAWNKGKHRMLLIHPQSAGHGMNLQYGGHHLVIYDLWYSLELFLQLIGRLDRPGQTHQVMVHLLCAQGTIDEYVAENLQRLRKVEDDMFRRLRERAKEILRRRAGLERARQPVSIL